MVGLKQHGLAAKCKHQNGCRLPCCATQTKKLEMANVSDGHARDVMRHGQLAAERAAHDNNVVDRDRYMTEVKEPARTTVIPE